MKRRVRKIVNFFAFNVLFFALYLNFIHKDNSGIPVASSQHQSTALSNDVTVISNPAQSSAATAQKPTEETRLRLSIN